MLIDYSSMNSGKSIFIKNVPKAPTNAKCWCSIISKPLFEKFGGPEVQRKDYFFIKIWFLVTTVVCVLVAKTSFLSNVYFGIFSHLNFFRLVPVKLVIFHHSWKKFNLFRPSKNALSFFPRKMHVIYAIKIMKRRILPNIVLEFISN